MNTPIQLKMGLIQWTQLIVLGLVWGATLYFTEIALHDLPPVTIAFIRVTLAAAVLVCIVYAMGHRLPGSLRAWKTLFIMGLLNNAVPFSLIMWGQTQITGSLAGILNATTPLSTVIVAHFLTRDEKLNTAKLTGIGFGLAGVAIMIGWDALQGLGAAVFAQLAVIAAGIIYAFAGVYGRRFQAMPAVVTAAGQLIASALILMPFSIFLDQSLSLPMPSLASWLALVAMAVFSTALAYVLYFKLLASSGATNLLLVTFLVPVSAIFLGFLFLGERLGGHHFTGMALIAAGLIAIDGRVFSQFKQKN